MSASPDRAVLHGERVWTCPDCGGHNWYPNGDLTLRCVNCGWNTK